MAVADSTTTGRHGDIHDSEYGKSSKELIEFVGQLRALGYVDNIPQFLILCSLKNGADRFFDITVPI